MNRGKISRVLWEINKKRFIYLWISPFFLLYSIFYLWPVLFSIYLSFHKWQGIGPMRYIGGENFLKLLRDAHFWTALYNTFFIWFFVVPIRTFLALLVGVILISSLLKLKPLFRVLFILPYITALVVVSVIFRIIFAQYGGWLNAILVSFGIKPIPWLSSQNWSKLSLGIVLIWRELGYYSIVMVGGLQGIPRGLYEAAFIDGANRFQTFWWITVPLMRPIILFVLIISTVWIFRLFTIPFILTSGGPQYSSTPFALFLYEETFDFLHFGYGSTIAISMFVFVLLASLVQVKFMRQKK